MPPTSSHTIQRQTLLIQVPDLDAAQRVRQQAEQLCRGPLATLLDTILSAAVAPDEVLYLERLTVDLKISSPERFEDEFMAGIGKQLSAALDTLRKNAGGPPASHAPVTSGSRSASDSAGPHPPPVGGSESHFPMAGGRGLAESAAEGAARILSREAADMELLELFLRWGRLPGWAPPETADRLEAMWIEALRSESAAARAWLAALLKERRVRLRLARQFSAEALDRVAVRLWHQPPGMLEGVADRLAQRLSATSPQAAAEMRRKVWEGLLDRLAASPEQCPDPAKLEAGVLADLLPADGVGAARLPRAASKETRAAGGAAPPDDRPALESALAAKTSSIDAAGAPATPAGVWERPDTSAAVGLSSASVPNAGLVLVWPYLGRFFGSLGWTSAQGFVDGQAAIKAVLLLHHMVWQTDEATEPHLLLNKILCGLPPETPVPRRTVLEAAEKSACEGLLAAVIAHWQALKKTSTAGLRATFLQRFGLLSQVQDRWHLRVERRPFDLLLDRLPWGIAAVQLSWMPRMLSVEWSSP
jgi:hypothetical protein